MTAPGTPLLTDAGAGSSNEEETPEFSSAREALELPHGHLLQQYGLCMPDAAIEGPMTMKEDPVIPKLEDLKVAQSSRQVIVKTYPLENNLVQGLQTSKDVRQTMSKCTGSA